MRFSSVILCCFVIPCLGTYSIAGEHDVSNYSPPAEWTTPGTEWVINIKQYRRSAGKGYGNPRTAKRALIPKVQCEFHMNITVLEPRSEGDERIARIRFTPMDDAPESMKGTIRVLELVASTGYAIGITEDEKPIVLRGANKLGREHALFRDMYGFPTDWIVSAADLARIPTRLEDRSVLDSSSTKKLRATVMADGKTRALEVEFALLWLGLDATPYRRVVQTWVPGEGWWRSFTRYYYTGNPDLEATLVDRKGE